MIKKGKMAPVCPSFHIVFFSCLECTLRVMRGLGHTFTVKRCTRKWSITSLIRHSLVGLGVMETRKRKLISKTDDDKHVRKRADRLKTYTHPDEIHSLYFPIKATRKARVKFDFFNQPCVDLAKAFLGKVSENFIVL